jgi:hypothetical protein
MLLNYSNTAPPVAITAAVTASATTLTVSSTAGYPDAPFLLSLARGTANEEVVLCTAKAATTFTVQRGYDGTTGKAHAVGAVAEHTVSALVYRGAGIIRITTAQRNSLTGDNLWEGRTIYNSTTKQLEVWTGTVWDNYLPRSGSTSVAEVERLIQRTDNRRTNLTYTGGKLTQVLERDSANTTTLKTTTLNYTGDLLTSTVETVGGKTITTTLNYTGDDLTSVTRAVA